MSRRGPLATLSVMAWHLSESFVEIFSPHHRDSMENHRETDYLITDPEPPKQFGRAFLVPEEPSRKRFREGFFTNCPGFGVSAACRVTPVTDRPGPGAEAVSTGKPNHP